MAEHYLDMLGLYIKTSERGLVHARNEDREKLERQDQMEGRSWVQNTSDGIGHLFAFNEEFPMIMRYGHITAVYSYVE